MAVSELDRARIVLDLIKDGDTTAGDPAYAGLDKIGPTEGNKYAEAFWKQYPSIRPVDGEGVEIDYGSLTNAQKGALYMNAIRAYHKSVLRASRAPAAGDAARAAEIATVDAEITTDLGTDE